MGPRSDSSTASPSGLEPPLLPDLLDPGGGSCLWKAFRVLIPPVLLYGYPWSRSGSVAVGQGTYLNIRAFQKPYGGLPGGFRDNPYAISITARPPPPPPAPPAIEPSPEPPPPQVPAPPSPDDDRTSSKLVGLIEPEAGKSLDLVVCLDTTDSMTPYIDDLRAYLGPVLKARVAGFSRFRIGIVLFRGLLARRLYHPEVSLYLGHRGGRGHPQGR